MADSFLIASLPLLVSPLSLVAGAVACAAVSRVEGKAKRTALRVASVSACLFGALPVVVSLPGARAGATVLSHVARLFRVGSLDGVIGFAMDGLGATVALAALVLAGIASFLLAGRDDAEPSEVAVPLLAGAGAVTAALAEGFPTLMLGLAVSFLVARSFAREARRASPQEKAPARAKPEAAAARTKKKSRKAKPAPADAETTAPTVSVPGAEPSVSARAVGGIGFFGAGAALSIVAFGVLFWALGGRWLDDTRYLADYRPRFRITGATAAPTEKPNATPNAAARTNTTDYLGMVGQKGTLTIVSHPGARVYLGVSDESQLVRSDAFAVTPFVKKELPAGLQKIVIVPGGAATVGGDGLEAALVDTVSIKQGTETVITLDGPTMTFHELAPQLADRSDVANRRLGTARAGTAIGLATALCLVALALGFRRALELGGRRAGAATMAAVALALVALGAFALRLGSLASLTPWGATSGALALAAVATFASVRDRCVAAPMAALVGLAGMLGGPGAAVVVAVACGFGLVALAFAFASAPSSDAPPLPRLLLTSALSGAPVPVGPFLGIAGAVGAAASGSTAFMVAAAAVAIAWAALAFAVGVATRDAHAGTATTLVAALGAVAGIVIAVFVRPWSGPDGRGSFAAVFVGLLAAVAAFVAMRRAARVGADAPRNDAEAAPLLSSWRARAARALDMVEMVAALPTTLIDLALGVPKRERASDDVENA